MNTRGQGPACAWHTIVFLAPGAVPGICAMQKQLGTLQRGIQLGHGEGTGRTSVKKLSCGFVTGAGCWMLGYTNLVG